MIKKSNVIKKTIDFNLPNPPFKVEGKFIRCAIPSIGLKISKLDSFMNNILKEAGYLYDKVICSCKVKFKECDRANTVNFVYSINKDAEYDFDITYKASKLSKSKLTVDTVEIVIKLFDPSKLEGEYTYRFNGIEAETTNVFSHVFKNKEVTYNRSDKIELTYSDKYKKYYLELFHDKKDGYSGSTNLYDTFNLSRVPYKRFGFANIKISFKQVGVDIPIIATGFSDFFILREIIPDNDEAKRFFDTPYLSGDPFTLLHNEIISTDSKDDSAIIQIKYSNKKTDKLKMAFPKSE